jgi:hypothetical protein
MRAKGCSRGFAARLAAAQSLAAAYPRRDWLVIGSGSFILWLLSRVLQGP